MSEQLVAVAVANNGSISPHAGRALQWNVYVIADEVEARLAWTLNLTKVGCLHEWHVRGEGERHPLHVVDVAIAASAGEGVRRRLEKRQTELLTTSETNPVKAVADYRAGSLAAGLPHESQACLHP